MSGAGGSIQASDGPPSSSAGDYENGDAATASTLPLTYHQRKSGTTTIDRKSEDENKKRSQDGAGVAKQPRIRNAIRSRVLLLDGTEYECEIEVYVCGRDAW